MAYIKLRNRFTTIEGNPSVLYNQNANELVEVWFERSGDSVYAADEANPAAGEYQHSSAVWELFGPDGPEVHLLDDPLSPGLSGSPDNPMTFLPTIPGRWLVRLTVLPYVSTDGITVTLGTEAEVFTGLFEIQDPNIIGHYAAREYGNGSITRGASFIAPNESNEYDSDEGWSRGLERYLATVSREQGFRSTIVVYNDSGVTLDEGKVVCATDTDALEAWKKADIGLQNFQNTVLRVQLAQATNPNILNLPKYLMTETIEDGERGVAIVEGIVPFDTTAFAGGEVIYVDSNGELTSTQPTHVDPLTVDARVGMVSKGATSDTDANPGSVYFHGHTSLIPGFIQGPLSSHDDGIATWDGVNGDKLQSPSNIFIKEDVTSVTILGGSKELHIKGAEHLGKDMVIDTGESHMTDSGDLLISTGKAESLNNDSGDLEINTGDSDEGRAGALAIEVGASAKTPGTLSIKGGYSLHQVGGSVLVRGGNTGGGAGTSAGDVVIRGGLNLDDNSRGVISLELAKDINISAIDSINIMSPVIRTTGFAGWLAADPAGVAADKAKVNIFHNYGVNTKFYMFDEAETESVELNSDSHSSFLKGLSIGTAAAPAGTDVLHVEGSGTFTDLTVTNKLNVGGLIDPIGLILTPTSQDNVVAGMEGADGGLFISDGTDGLTSTELYFRDSNGATHNLITGGLPGAAMAGPFAADSTIIDQVTTWANTSGDAIKGSVFSLDANGYLRTLSTPVTGVSPSINIKPGDHAAPAVHKDGASVTITSGDALGNGDGGELRLEGADAIGGLPGNVRIKAGDSDNAVGGGTTHISGGDGSKELGSITDGGIAEISGGIGGKDGGKVRLVGGSSIIDTPIVRVGKGDGGDVEVLGGLSGEAGAGGTAFLRGGPGVASGAGTQGGSGGNAVVAAGSAGLDSGLNGGEVIIAAGDGDSSAASAGPGGTVKISAGNSPKANVVPNALNGGDVIIEAGDAGIGSFAVGAIPPGGSGGNIYIEPGVGDTALPPFLVPHGILHLCKQNNGGGIQKSYVVIGDQSISGLPGPIGVCAGAKAHTIHGHLKVTGIIDPIAFLLEPQAANPVQQMLEDAQAAGLNDAGGNLIDASDATSQQMIRNAIWFDSNNEDRMMLGDEPVGTMGTIKYDSPDGPITHIDADALPYSAEPDGTNSGHIQPDTGTKVYYYNAPAKVGVILVDCSLGDVAIMLPDAAELKGRALYVKDMTGSSNTDKGQIFIVPPDGQNLDQYSYNTPYPLQPWSSRQCYSNGTNWFLI